MLDIINGMLSKLLSGAWWYALNWNVVPFRNVVIALSTRESISANACPICEWHVHEALVNLRTSSLILRPFRPLVKGTEHIPDSIPLLHVRVR